jgi:hypothetical protein
MQHGRWRQHGSRLVVFLHRSDFLFQQLEPVRTSDDVRQPTYEGRVLLRCYHRVVFFLPLVVVFCLARIILDDDTSLVKSYYNWYKEYHNPKYHFGGTGSGIFN